MPTTESPERPGRPRRGARAWLWPTLKGVLGVTVVAAVGWQFAVVLRQPDLWARPLSLHPGWLAVAAALYLAGLLFPAIFWRLLLRALGQRPRPLATLRAYYVGQLARYVPGKVVGLAMRARLLTGPGVGMGVAVLTVVYESLTTLAAGVLLGMLLFAFPISVDTAFGWRALALLGAVGVLLLPGVFNRLAERTTRPFRRPDAPPFPPVRNRTLVVGLAITGCGWLVQGGALWAVVESLAPGAWPASAEVWCRCAAYTGLAYAAGYLVFAAPGGLGVRDYVTQQFLLGELGRALGPQRAAETAVVAALVLRLVWIAADLAAAGACYGLPGQGAGAQPE